METVSVVEVKSRVEVLLKELCKGLYEREQSVRLAFLATVAGESIFLLGPPGVGKSLIARRLKYAFLDGTSFEYLMSKYSTPDEIFGPVSIKKLKDEDVYERITDNYMPSANIVFLDEIWKAGPAIQNALLTILNEKIYKNGNQTLKVDIKGIITASNELPPKNKSLDPIWDRFLIRLELDKIKSFKNFLDMIVSTDDVYKDNIPSELKLKSKDLDKWSAEIDAVDVPAEILNTIQVVTYKIEQFNQKPNNEQRQIRIYDRRWKKIIRLMRTSAFLNGRDKVDLMDCFLMEHCLWNYPEHRPVIRDIVIEAVRKHGYSMAINLSALKKEVAEFEKDVEEEIQIKNSITEDQLLPVNEHYYRLHQVSSKFKGELIDINQFRSLLTDEEKVINYFDADENLINRVSTRKGGRENTIIINFNGDLQTFDLETVKRERTEIIYKKPHKVVAQFWDERFERLSHYITEQSQKLDSQAPAELDGIDGNLFVDRQWSEVVSANLEEVKMALQNLQLRLEKLQFSYAKV